MLRKQLQLGLVHVAVTMTLIPINSTLNRVMIHEMAISATLVAILASLPFLFSPLQFAIGSYSDHHPILGLRRTPYIVLGLLLCVIGLGVSPQVAFLMQENSTLGLLAATIAFGAWGMGYNLSGVSYLALASDLSGEKGRGRTVAIMWFMMIIGIICTSLALSRMMKIYNPETLQSAFWVIGGMALLLGILGLIKLEAASGPAYTSSNEVPIREMLRIIRTSPQVVLFFIYLLLLLAAILGQDVLLEPFAARAFDMSVEETSRISSIMGSATLLTILLAGILERRMPRKVVAQTGNLAALAGFLVILAAGFTASQTIFYTGLILLGAGTGLSTVANLALMFDLTLPGYAGVFIGAWGVSNACSRLLGNLMTALIRDIFTLLDPESILGYAIGFALEAAMLAVAAFMLTRIDVSSFQNQVQPLSTVERAALAD